MVSMANCGPNTNGSQFFIVTNLVPSTYLDGHHVVFGKVTYNMQAADFIDRSEDKTFAHINDKKELGPIIINDCGEYWYEEDGYEENVNHEYYE